MSALDRRRWLAGAGALTLAGGPARAAKDTAMYDYLFLDLPASSGAPPAAGLTAGLKAQRAVLAADGIDVLGLFTPQLGWRARQAALLIRRSGRGGKMPDLAGAQVAERHALTPTARPATGDKPRPGGIHVHRWFVVETPALPEFVALSTEGWRDFEARFDTNIFGLLAAEASDADRAQGVTRLLLITRYGSHGVWEASRDPSTAAMAAFQRRQRLTRDTWAASTLLTEI